LWLLLEEEEEYTLSSQVDDGVQLSPSVEIVSQPSYVRGESKLPSSPTI